MDPGLKKAIKESRQAAGMTQEDAADRAGMAATGRWSELERPHGRAKPMSLLEIKRAAEAIGGETVAIVRRAMEITEADK